MCDAIAAIAQADSNAIPIQQFTELEAQVKALEDELASTKETANNANSTLAEQVKALEDKLATTENELTTTKEIANGADNTVNLLLRLLTIIIGISVLKVFVVDERTRKQLESDLESALSKTLEKCRSLHQQKRLNLSSAVVEPDMNIYGLCWRAFWK